MMMRKKGLIFLVIIAALLIALNMVVTDRWLERRVERFASRANGAKVELHRFNLSLLDLSLSWDQLQVTDPDDTWTNLFETGRCSFDLALQPLLQRKVLVEEFDLQGLRLGTPRETDGALAVSSRSRGPGPGQSRIVQTIEQNIRTEIESYPLLNLGLLTGTVDLDRLWDEAALQSPERIRAMKAEYSERYEQWEKRVKELPGETEAAALKREIGNLEIEQIDTAQEAAEAYETLQSIESRNRAYANTAAQMGEAFAEEKRDAAGLREEIDAWVEEDVGRLLGMAGLPEISRESVAAMLFGRPVAARMEKALNVVGKARSYSQKVGKYIPAKEIPPRGVGQDIRFIREQDYPRFWIKSLNITGETPQGIGIGGEVLHLVSDQRRIDLPTTLQLGGTRSDGAGLDFSAMVDGRGDDPREWFDLVLTGIPVQGRRITEFPLLSYPLSSGEADIAGEINFNGSDFTAAIGYSARDVDFDTTEAPETLNDDLYRLSRSMIRKIDDIQLEVKVEQRGDDFSLSMQSNLDDIVLQGVGQLVTDEVKAARDILMQRIEREIGPGRTEVESLVLERDRELLGSIREAEARFTEVQGLIEQKREEIKSTIQAEEKLKEQQEILENRGKEVLDSLF
jgi:uncharacterized protein (TIGR03545 family)